MKAAGVSTSRYCRVPDSAILVKKIKEALDFFRWKNQTLPLIFWQDDRWVWSLVIWNFPNNERSSFYSYTLRVVIEDIIDILKNINNESRWRIDISILQSSRLSCQKDQRVLLIFSVGKIKHCLWSFWQDDKGIWSLVIWNFPNNERSIFYSYTLRVVIEDIIDILKNINNESRWRIDISILQSSRLCRVGCLVKKIKEVLWFFPLEKNQTLPLIFWQDDKVGLISRYLEFSK